MRFSVFMSSCLLLFSVAGGCQQEEFSFESKLIGYWQSEKVLIDGDESETLSKSIHIDFQSHEYRRVFETGKWSLSENKDSVIFMPDTNGITAYSAEIRRLTANELWLVHMVDNQLYEEYYAKKDE